MQRKHVVETMKEDQEQVRNNVKHINIFWQDPCTNLTQK